MRSLALFQQGQIKNPLHCFGVTVMSGTCTCAHVDMYVACKYKGSQHEWGSDVTGRPWSPNTHHPRNSVHALGDHLKKKKRDKNDSV